MAEFDEKIARNSTEKHYLSALLFCCSAWEGLRREYFQAINQKEDKNNYEETCEQVEYKTVKKTTTLFLFCFTLVHARLCLSICGWLTNAEQFCREYTSGNW
jgi:hypothetical protein